MKTWRIRVNVDGGSMPWVTTGLVDYQEAVSFAQNLYGPDVQILDHEFVDTDEAPRRRGLFGW